MGGVWLQRIFSLVRETGPRRREKMEKALTKVGSFWISKKAKEEISNITEDLSVRSHSLFFYVISV